VDRYARWNTLLEILAETGRITVEDAANRLGVSQATIRRDFDQLSQQQMITRTRGGAVAGGISYDLPLRYKTARHVEEKHRIGTAAAGLVSPGQVIALNGGTTITEVARALATRTDLVATPGSTGLTIVTNALNIANELIVRPHLKVVVVGGVVRPQSYELIGPLAAPILREITLDIAFLGVDAIDIKLGATSHHEGEAAINALMAARARKVVVIADGSKIGGHAFARICATDRVHTLVTDGNAPSEQLRAFEEVGIRVIVV
jgi:DeoR family transcriptional regulator of aga operon